MTRNENGEIILAVSTMLGDILSRHVGLNETLLSQGAGVESQKLKLNSLKARLADEKRKLAKLKGAAKRKTELEKIRLGYDGQIGKAD